MDEITLFLNPYSMNGTKSANDKLIQDVYGSIAVIHKSLLTDNHLQAENGTIKVSPGLYAAWFGGCNKKTDTEKFVDNIELILSCKEIIYSDSRLFMAELPFALCGSIWTGSWNLSLGTLIKSWEDGTFDYQCPNCPNLLKLLSAGGSLGSGMHIARGYCFKCHRLVTLKTDFFPKYFKIFNDAKKRHQKPENAEPFTFGEAFAILKYLEKI